MVISCIIYWCSQNIHSFLHVLSYQIKLHYYPLLIRRWFTLQINAAFLS